VLFPLVARAFGLIATIIGIMVVTRNLRIPSTDESIEPGILCPSILAAVFFYFTTMWLLGNIWFFYAGLIGIALSLAFVYITIYYTDYGHRPVATIASAPDRSGDECYCRISVGLEATAVPAIAIGVALMLSYLCGQMSGVPYGGLYGTAIATMGMLAPVPTSSPWTRSGQSSTMQWYRRDEWCR